MEKGRREHNSGLVFKVFPYIRKIVWEMLLIIVPGLIISLFLNVTIAKAVQIESGPSMQPNLFQGNCVMIEKVSYRFHSPERGDIVVVNRPVGEVSLIKRVMGLPGETIEVRDGHALINGLAIEEPWVAYFGGPGFGPVKIPDGYVFIMGDNRQVSHDSRAIGFVAISAIEGRVWLVYWPLKMIRLVP